MEKKEKKEEKEKKEKEKDKKKKKGFPVKEPSLKVPFMESLAERCPTTTVLLHSPFKVPGIRAPPHTTFPSGGKRPLRREKPASRDFLNIFPRVPNEGPPLPPPRPPPRRLFRERGSTPRASFIHLSKSPVEEPFFRFPNGVAMERDAHLQSLFYISFRVPSKGVTLQVSFTELPQRET